MKRDTSEVNVRRTNDGRVGFLRSCSSPASINPYLGGGMILFRSKKFRIFFTAIDESEQAFEVLNILIRLISFVWIPNTFIIFLDLWIDGFPWIFLWDVFVLFIFWQKWLWHAADSPANSKVHTISSILFPFCKFDWPEQCKVPFCERSFARKPRRSLRGLTSARDLET